MSDERLLKMIWEEDGQYKIAKGYEMNWLDEEKTIIIFNGINGDVIINKSRLVSIK